MGAKDRKANEYFADNRRFADMCNAVLFGGRTVILPEALEATDTTELLSVLGMDGKEISFQKFYVFQPIFGQIRKKCYEHMMSGFRITLQKKFRIRHQTGIAAQEIFQCIPGLRNAVDDVITGGGQLNFETVLQIDFLCVRPAGGGEIGFEKRHFDIT